MSEDRKHPGLSKLRNFFVCFALAASILGNLWFGINTYRVAGDLQTVTAKVVGLANKQADVTNDIKTVLKGQSHTLADHTQTFDVVESIVTELKKQQTADHADSAHLLSTINANTKSGVTTILRFTTAVNTIIANETTTINLENEIVALLSKGS